MAQENMAHERMPQTMPHWHLEILDGPNAGAALALAPGAYQLGSGPGNDIVLCGDNVADTHVSFEIGTKGAALTALAPGAALRQRAIAPGRRVEVGRDAEFSLGSTRVRVRGPEAASRRAVGRTVGACALAGLLGTALLYELPGGAVPSRAPVPHAAGAVADIAAVRDTFAKFLDASKLRGTIRLATDNGALLAAGAILPAETAQWQAAKTWFDQHYGSRMTLLDEVHAAADAMPELAIAAVSLQPVPNIVTQDGERYTEGAVLDGGWSITKITRSGVTLRRAGREIRFAL